jgi:hypothetical protein
MTSLAEVFSLHKEAWLGRRIDREEAIRRINFRNGSAGEDPDAQRAQCVSNERTGNYDRPQC